MHCIGGHTLVSVLLVTVIITMFLLTAFSLLIYLLLNHTIGIGKPWLGKPLEDLATDIHSSLLSCARFTGGLQSTQIMTLLKCPAYPLTWGMDNIQPKFELHLAGLSVDCTYQANLAADCTIQMGRHKPGTQVWTIHLAGLSAEKI